jgi:hypothetical protein
MGKMRLRGRKESKIKNGVFTILPDSEAGTGPALLEIAGNADWNRLNSFITRSPARPFSKRLSGNSSLRQNVFPGFHNTEYGSERFQDSAIT